MGNGNKWQTWFGPCYVALKQTRVCTLLWSETAVFLWAKLLLDLLSGLFRHHSQFVLVFVKFGAFFLFCFCLLSFVFRCFLPVTVSTGFIWAAFSYWAPSLRTFIFVVSLPWYFGHLDFYWFIFKCTVLMSFPPSVFTLKGQLLKIKIRK